jgi:hypothetical protein
VTSEFAVPEPLDLTLVAETLIVQGRVRSRFRRLSDLMNDPDSTHVVMIDATFMEIGTRRVMAEAAAARIATDSILFAHSTTPTPGSPELRQPRRGVSATLLLPPYTIEGKVHLPYESELTMALAVYEGRFLPITQARYWAELLGEEPRQADLLMVNHALTHIAIPAGAEWNPNAAMEAPGAASSIW